MEDLCSDQLKSRTKRFTSDAVALIEHLVETRKSWLPMMEIRRRRVERKEMGVMNEID